MIGTTKHTKNTKTQRSKMLAPRLLIALGDVAGIGPEIVLKAWPRLVEICRPIVVGDVEAGCGVRNR